MNYKVQGIFCMKYEIKVGKTFKKNFKHLSKKYHLIDKDLEKLLDELEANPYIGADLGGGVRKVRMAITDKGKGKSGGARVITYTIEVDESTGCVTLLTVYDKNEQSSISKKDIGELMAEAGL